MIVAALVLEQTFDTAQMYGNEAQTGAALAACGIARGEFCITTKVHPDNYSEEQFLSSVEASLKALQVDRVDALLLHWPPADRDVAPSLRLLQSARDKGLADAIGVSNYTARMMHVARSVVEGPARCQSGRVPPPGRPAKAPRRGNGDRQALFIGYLFGLHSERLIGCARSR